MDYLQSKGFMKPDNIEGDYSSQHKYSKLNVRTNVDVDLTSSTQLCFKMNGMLSEHNRPGIGAGDLMGLIYTTPSAAFSRKDSSRENGVVAICGHVTLLRRWRRKDMHEVIPASYLLMPLSARDLGMLLKGLSVDVRISYDNFCEYWDNYPMSYAYAVANVAHPSSADDYTLQGAKQDR